MKPPIDASGMPEKTPKSVELTEEQRSALFGGECAPGESYTITLKAGDVGDGGTQTFDVVSEGGEDESGMTPEQDMAEDAAEGETPDTDEEGAASPDAAADPAEIKALGYDRSKFGRKKPFPRISAKDLETD